jgi:HEAT repeat protein
MNDACVMLRYVLPVLAIAQAGVCGCADVATRAPVGGAGAAWRAAAEPLLVQLKNIEDGKPWEVAPRLAKIPDAGVIPPLVAWLTGEDSELRHRAADVLDDYLEVRHDLEWLAEEESRQRGESARETALRRQRAIEAPPGYDWDRYATEMRDQADAVQRALNGVFRGMLRDGEDPRRIAVVFGALRHWTRYNWSEVRAPEIGRSAVPGLLAALKDEDPEVRAGAAVALGKIGDASAVAPVIALLEDRDVTVRCHAATALRDFADPRVVPALIGALKRVKMESEEGVLRCGNVPDPQWESAASAAWALGKMKCREAVEPLMAALEQGDNHFAMFATEALGRIGDSRAIPPLMALWHKPSIDLGEELSIGDALVRIGKPSIEPLIRAMKCSERRFQAAYYLAEIGESAIEPLIDLMRSEDESQRREILWEQDLMCESQGLSAESVLVAARDDEEDLRRTAAWALGSIKGPRIMPRLFAALRDGNPGVRAGAIMALEHAEDVRAVGPIIPCLFDTHTSVRCQAIWTLQQLGDQKAILPLASVAEKDPDEESRASAAYAILNLNPGPDAIPVLNRLLLLNTTDFKPTFLAAEALANIGGEKALAALTACLKANGDADKRGAAAFGLGLVKDGRAVDALLAALGDAASNVRAEAATSLGKQGNAKAIAPLSQLAKEDPEIDVRKVAAEAVQAIQKPVR